MISFAWPYLLLALPLPLLVYFLPAKRQVQVAALKVPALVTGLDAGAQTDTSKKLSIAVLCLVWILLVIAASRPQWLGEPIDIPTEGREMMIAVDLSGSMRVEDMSLNGSTVNRLQMLKVLLGDFIERRVGDRLGLILFGDDAYMQTPMTFDRETVGQMLDETVLGLVGQKTAIGDAIGLAVKRFEQKAESNRVLLLLTDGQNTAGKITPEQALELAVAKGITIYTIGIGADVMLQRSLFGMRQVNPSSELDEKTLTELAEQTGGRYFRARDSESMAQIYQLLDQLEPVEQDQQQMRPLTALFFWPLGLAMVIATLHLLWLNLPNARRFNQLLGEKKEA
ncbi:VWA domain-containing protein [Thalassotalea euphylliae]|uniref:VWA domain-containing protein n=1 Tax=Thalassotalea euphylliae TaxID=1655234 RepID=A0A3E0TNI2_9GAMM|nr:VWA domain-containing protein [Thalassotalea euphylliae]REL26161.1 VWA domain-containing protein [Thalassotalea euphylliae]